MSLPRQSVSAYLQGLAASSGKSYREIEAATGVPLSTISRIMRGRTLSPNVDAVSAIVAYLGGSMDELAGIQPGEPAEGVTPDRTRDPWEEVERARLAHIAVLNDRIRSQRRTIIILSIVLAAVLSWFIWDITHPDAGLIRLMQKSGCFVRLG